MPSKHNSKIVKEQRKAVKVLEPELQEWKDHFSLHGTKRDLQLQKNIPPLTLNRLLLRGHAEQKIVAAVREYVESEKQNLITDPEKLNANEQS